MAHGSCPVRALTPDMVIEERDAHLPLPMAEVTLFELPAAIPIPMPEDNFTFEAARAVVQVKVWVSPLRIPPSHAPWTASRTQAP